MEVAHNSSARSESRYFQRPENYGGVQTQTRRGPPLGIFPSWSQSFPMIIKGLIFPPLAGFYRIKYSRHGELTDLQLSIKFSLAALATTQIDHPSLPHYQQRLAIALRDRYRKLGDTRDLQLSLTLQASALASTPSMHEDVNWHRQNLDVTYHERYRHFGMLSDLHAAIHLETYVTSSLPEGSPLRGWWMGYLASSHSQRFLRLGEDTDLEDGITWSLLAFDATPEGDTSMASRRLAVGTAYSYKVDRYKTTDDLDLAMFWMHSALEITPNDQCDYYLRQQCLATLYKSRYVQTGNLQHLQKSLDLCKQNIDMIPTHLPNIPECYLNIGSYHFTRYQHIGNLEDLETAIKWVLDAIKYSKTTNPDIGVYYGQLASCYLEKYLKFGTLDDIETAIKWSEDAVRSLSHEHPRSAIHQHNLAIIYLSRYRRHRNRKDIERAFQWSNSAITHSVQGDPELPDRRHLLAVLHRERFTLSEDTRDIMLALEIQKKVVAETLPHHPNVSARYSSLASIHSYAYEHIGGFEHRDAILKWNEAAADSARRDDPELHRYKYGIALQYLNRYFRLKEEGDLEHAIKVACGALDISPSDHPGLPGLLQVLAQGHVERYQLNRETRDQDSALMYFRQATEVQNANPGVLWAIAEKWAAFAEHQGLPECLIAYAAGYRILPELLWLGNTVTSRHEALVKHNITIISTKAITACIKFENYPLAIEFLEQSLGITFQQLLDLRSDLSELKERFPGYANLLEQLSAELQKAAISLEHDAAGGTAQNQSVSWDRQRKLAMERGELLRTIRQLPDFENFLLPAPFKSLASAAKDGPVIIINCSTGHMADAVIVFPNKTTAHVSLRVMSGRIKTHADLLRSALKYHGIHSRQIDEGRAGRLVVAKGKDGTSLFNTALDWIWKAIVSPIFDVLKKNGVTDGRVWWCVTGQLMNLPIHAAGPPNDYIQSYTSTLSALLRARLQAEGVHHNARVTAIGLAKFGADSSKNLPNVKLEIEVLKSVVGDDRVVVFMDEKATLENVAEQLPQASWLHLACHGQQGNTQDPLRSGLLLYNNEKLELENIISTPIPTAVFVFLSACETAMGDNEMTNESLHLAGGMIFAGFKAAIGTLWAIHDRDGPVVAKAVYSRLFQGKEEPDVTDTAKALHFAIRDMRERGAPPHRWVPFIHIGI